MDEQAPDYRKEFFKSPHHAVFGLLTLGIGFLSANLLGLIAGATAYTLGWIYLPDLSFFRRWVDKRHEAVRRAADAKIPPAAGQGRRVLVIEDDADSRRAMAHFLGDAGFAVRTAEDTEEAVALLREGFRPGALLVDYRLRRGVTGAQAAADVCAAAGRKLPTLIVTGDTEPSRLKDVAATGYPILHKPVHPEALLRSMLALFDET